MRQALPPPGTALHLPLRLRRAASRRRRRRRAAAPPRSSARCGCWCWWPSPRPRWSPSRPRHRDTEAAAGLARSARSGSPCRHGALGRVLSGLLGFEKTSDTEVAGSGLRALTGLSGLRARVVSMRLGAERIELTEFLAPRGRAAPADSRSNDAWFQHVAIITSDIEQGYLWLRQHNVQQVSPRSQRLPDWNPKAGGIKAFYFRDTDGHPLEILEFPPDKGDPRWHRPRAIASSSASTIPPSSSRHRVQPPLLPGHPGPAGRGGSVNWGRSRSGSTRRRRAPAHHHAARRDRARRRAARPDSAHRRPADGRQRSGALAFFGFPGRSGGDRARLRAGPDAFASLGVLVLPDRALGFGAGFLARDPDGHALRVTGPEGAR